MKKKLFFGLTTPIVLTSSIATIFSCSTVEIYDVNVISTNDIHGRMIDNATTKNEATEAGIANISSWLKTQKYDLLLDAGDLIQGTALNDLDNGKTIAKIANIMNYDAIAVGNHEFDFGLDNLLDIVKNHNQSYLSSNVYYKESQERVFIGSKVKILNNGLKVGIIGLTTEETSYKTHPKNVEKVVFKKIVDETKKEIERFENEGINFITVVSHVGEYETVPLARELENKIDLIVDGHSQIEFNEKIGTTHIIQTGEYTKAVRKTNFKFNNKTGFIENFSSELVKPKEIIDASKTNGINQEINDLITQQQSKLESDFKTVILDHLPYKLNGERKDVRNQETNIGNLIADSMFYKAQQTINDLDFAFTNSGGIRNSINIGKVTKKETYDVLPFGNTLVAFEIKGSILKDVFNHAIKQRGQGAFLQVSEQIQIKQINEQNQIEIKINNKPIEDNKIYKVATNDFTHAGGDGYDMLKGTKEILNSTDLRYSFEEYLVELSKNNNVGFEKYKTELSNTRWILINNSTN